MPIDDRTTNRSYQLPNAGNLLLEDVARLRAALQSIDADIFARYTKLEVDQLINNLINGAPGALNTLNELADALGDDPNFAATVTTQLALKANASAVYSKAESDARYVQGSTQAEMVFTATANQSVFTLSTAVINKPSALVTVDGVVQPSAEYSLNMAGTQLTLSEGVPAGTVVRVLALGVASAGAPADDTVTTPKLRNGAVTNEKVAEDAAIAGTKINPDFGSQNVRTAGGLQGASMNGGPLAGFRNLIINGNPTINQRGYVSGDNTTSANQYTLDRWRVVTSGQNITFTDSAGVRTVTAPAGGFEQVIEGASIIGGTYTLSWNGTATATVNGSAVAKGANFTLAGGSNATVRLSGGTFSLVQLEPGPVATPFELRPIGIELALCQRYFCKSYDIADAPGTVTDAGAIYTASATVGLSPIGQSTRFPVPMRGTPVITIYNPVTGNSNSSRRSNSNVTPTIINIGRSGFAFESPGTSAYFASGHYTASAEL
jgi:hypothetical protein